MSSICPHLTQLYQVWSDSLMVMKDARLSYQETGSLEDKMAFDQALLRTKEAQEGYQEVAYALVDYKGSFLIQIEALVVGLLQTYKFSQLKIIINQGHVVLLGLDSLDVSSTSIINQAVSLAFSYLSKLAMFSCFDSQLSSLPEDIPASLQRLICRNSQLAFLPEEIPDTIQFIDIQGTPAAEDPKVQKKLKAFQEAHPGAQVRW